MIRIQGHNYRMLFTSEILPRDSHIAQCGILEGFIKIIPGMTDSKTKESFLHEIIEALNGHFALDMDHAAIQTLAVGLYQVIADNPEVFQMTLPKGDT